MKNEYNHNKIEKKWQKFWADKKIYKTSNDTKKKKMYVLDMFPYPSGAGLHVGHPRGYIGSDIYARMKRMQGYNVLHPMGYDAFGLPAEQYAIEHKVHPKVAVEKNIKTFEKQLSIIGLSYDWERKVNTTDPKYYKWTEWIFLQIFNSYYDNTKNKARPISELIKIFEKKGNIGIDAVCDNDTPLFDKKDWNNFSKLEKQRILMKYRLAYEGYADVNWCESLGTVLANDEILNGPNGELISERGGYKVVRKSMRQWFMRITAYAPRLLNDLADLDWNPHIKEIQKNWIGESVGAELDFQIKIKAWEGPSSPAGEDGPSQLDNIKIFTTRADTIDGATYLVLAPEHKKIQDLKNEILNYKEVEDYINKTKTKADDDRISAKEKTGVKLEGVEAINPFNGESLPVYIADYVLANYGTGAIMAVPMHDERDREFAEKFDLPIIDRPLLEVSKVLSKTQGKIVKRYKMRDAIFARQRYWGEPIPLSYDKDGIIKEVKNLPLLLPNVKSYSPLGTGESPLAGVKAWTKKGYETNTMPGWAGSSWYFLRYIDPNNSKEFASKKMLDYYFGSKNGGVDMYVGGAEHATGHLLYARFWHKFLYDIGKVKAKEPFRALRNQGMIGGADGRKMSKRWGNVINPDDVVATYGADTLRLYEAFMGPFDQGLPWSTESIVGSRRFVEKIYRLAQINFSKKSSLEISKTLHKTIKKVGEDIERFNFNTAVSTLMICANEIEKTKEISKDDFKKFLQISAPFISHLAEEIWFDLGEKKSIHLSVWPKVNPKFLIEEEIKIVIQVNGKVRGEIFVNKDITELELKSLILKREDILRFTEGKELKKFIYVSGRLASLVV